MQAPNCHQTEKVTTPALTHTTIRLLWKRTSAHEIQCPCKSSVYKASREWYRDMGKSVNNSATEACLHPTPDPAPTW